MERDIEISAPENVPTVGVHIPGAAVDTKKPGPRKKVGKAATFRRTPGEALPPESGDE